MIENYLQSVGGKVGHEKSSIWRDRQSAGGVRVQPNVLFNLNVGVTVCYFNSPDQSTNSFAGIKDVQTAGGRSGSNEVPGVQQSEHVDYRMTVEGRRIVANSDSIRQFFGDINSAMHVSQSTNSTTSQTKFAFRTELFVCLKRYLS
jgi:hypothetical protein